jgi:hypothetical protein
MTRSYAFSRKDANHDELAAVYLSLGCSCEDASALGSGFPDAVVGCAGVTDLVEFKTEDGKLEPAQETFVARWRGSYVWLVRSQADVIAHVNHMRKRAKRL